MFLVHRITDSVRVLPSNFGKNPRDAIIESLNSKYSNKIIHKIGLGILVYDLVKFSDFIVHACQDGGFQSNVEFLLLVFCPFRGEIVTGKIRSSTKDGISVSLGFFDDVFIPPSFLMANTTFNHQEGLWVWNYDGNELFMETNDPIRFRVESLEFDNVGPIMKQDDSTQSRIMGNTEKSIVASGRPAFRIVGSACESGLGLESWWDDQQQDDE